jgi:DNA/RNA endonuclease YhcR with UshA esterase domain
MNRRLRFAALFAALFVASGQAHAPQRVIPDSQAASYVGQTVTVEGEVASVHVARSATFLNVGAAYPKQTFTAIIFKSASNRFPNPLQREGKRVHVTGQVRLYRGRPKIVLADPSRLVAAPY